jgi:hypothetical protein
MKRDMWRVTSDEKHESFAGALYLVTRHASPVTPKS